MFVGQRQDTQNSQFIEEQSDRIGLKDRRGSTMQSTRKSNEKQKTFILMDNTNFVPFKRGAIYEEVINQKLNKFSENGTMNKSVIKPPLKSEK